MNRIPPSIRTEFNWPDEFRGIVTGYPVDAHCQAEAGCDNTVAYHADHHGCYQELMCTQHLNAWASLLDYQIVLLNYVTCNDCGRHFVEVADMLQARPV